MTEIIRIHEHGAPGVLRRETLEVGMPGPGQVRLRQEAIGLNYVDTMLRDGRYPAPLPLVPGFEGAGIVDAVGPQVDGIRAGDRVGYFFAPDAYAAERLIDAQALIPLPADIGSERAAAFLAKGLTAWTGLRALHALRAGETILVQGASGGVGAILSRWARALGATVIGVAGSPSKLDKVRAGAHHALLAGDPGFLQKLHALAPGGVDVVYDFVGQAVLDLTLGALRDGGSLLTIGAASGQARPDPALLARRGISVRGGSTAQYVSGPALARASAELFQAMRDGLFEDLALVRYPLGDAVRAHQDIGLRRIDGLPVLVPSLTPAAR
jgi:NADPH2:quinone reductase